MKNQGTLSISVLHVDDNANDRELVRLKFARHLPEGEVHSAANVHEAIQIMRSRDIDAVLSDYQMPDIDGLDFLHIIRGERPDIPFVFLTGQGNESLAAEALRSGADDYYSKEVGYRHFERLAKNLVSLVDTWRLKSRHEEVLIERLAMETERRIMLDTLDQAIAVVDGDLRLLHCNVAFARLAQRAGWSGDLRGEPMTAILTTLPQDMFAPFLDSGVAGDAIDGESAFDLNGSPVHLEYRFRPIREEERISRIVMVFTDVSRFRETEAQLNRTRQELERRVQMRTGELAEINARLSAQINERIKVEKIQTVLYRIANAAVAPLELTAFYEEIRSILGALFDTRCFYIALHTGGSCFTFPYAIDDHDDFSEPEYDLAGGLTWYVFTKGKPMIFNEKIRDEVLGADRRGIGHPAKIWMGAPLRTDKGIIGVMAVQSYTDDHLYTREELEVISFVSKQVAFAIERKHAQELLLRSHEELEQRVQERTADLAVANELLRKEIADREHAEKVQMALFNISDATFKADNLEELLRMAHRQLESLFPVPNIFIALYDHQGGIYSFPYFVDACDTIDIPPQKLGKSLTDYVRRTGQPLLLTSAIDRELQESGEIEVVGTPSLSWMGVPLISRTGVIGVMTIQSYTDDQAYSERELAIMDYVSGQIANAIERKSAEMEINTLLIDMQSQNQELDLLNKELEAFTYTVSHDLRSPLHRISGFASLLQEEVPQEAVLSHNYLARIQRSCERMNLLIHDLLAFSHANRAGITRGTVDLTDVTRKAVNVLQVADGERKVDIQVEDGLVCTGDAALLRVVMDNLLSNAWKYTRRQLDARIEVGEMRRNGDRAFYVRDNGVGFDPAQAGKLFTPFQRLHGQDEFEGSGIGLATVARIIYRHGGSVGAESHLGEGATFWFTLGAE